MQNVLKIINMENTKEIKLEESKTGKVPEGAKVRRTDCDYSVRKIENGFIVKKVTNVDYVYEGEYGYTTIVKEFFTKESPINVKSEGGKLLADSFK